MRGTRCPKCGASYAISEEIDGHLIDCTACRTTFRAASTPPLSAPSPFSKEHDSALPDPNVTTGRVSWPSVPAEPKIAIAAVSGFALTAVFYLAFVIPFSTSKLAEIYGDRGPVPFAIAFLSFWGGAAIGIKAWGLRRQRMQATDEILPSAIGYRIEPGHAAAYIEHLSHIPTRTTSSFLVSRVVRALEHFRIHGKATDTVESLRAQGDADRDAVDGSYTLIRTLIWAIPILGFIGTVMGISDAVGGFSNAMATSTSVSDMRDSIGGVTSGLGVAFDTTFLALVTSVVIMFPSAWVQRREEQVLADVENYCTHSLVPRLDRGDSNEVQTRALIRNTIAESLSEHEENLSLCATRLDALGDRAGRVIEEAVSQVAQKSAKEITDRLRVFADNLADSQKQAANVTMESNAELIRTMMATQSEALSQWRQAHESTSGRIETAVRIVQTTQMETEAAVLEHNRTVSEAMQGLLHTIDGVEHGFESIHQSLNSGAGAINAQVAVLADGTRALESAINEEREARRRFRTELEATNSESARRMAKEFSELTRKAADAGASFDASSSQLNSATSGAARQLENSGLAAELLTQTLRETIEALQAAARGEAPPRSGIFQFLRRR